jgi:4,5-dihydroxyphthalate decarboxylase
MANPKITFACTLYDRLLALRLGEVKVEGFDLDYESSYGTDNVRAIFDRVGAGKGTDVSEMSTSEFISGVATGKSRHVAIPVFPSRVFRCGFTFVNRDRIRQPKDLEGKRIGVPLYTMTAAVCARGHLSDEYGVDFSKVEWVQGAMNEAKPHGNPSAPPLLKPVNIVQNNSGKSLSQLLAAGEIDAVLGAITPDCFGKDHKIVRLFPDFREVELQYYRRTKVFHIMHTIVIKKDVHEKHPGLAQAFATAMQASKKMALERFLDCGSLQYMLPWLPRDVDEINEVFGGDPWPYGLEPNRPTLEALTRYLHEQGMTAHKVPLDGLFVDVKV